MSSGSESLRPTENQIQPTPPPWNVKAEAWWFINSLGHRPEPGETLPISYFPAQETHLYQASMVDGSFRGGKGAITLFRHIDTPIGPYDELAICPGEFTNPFDKESHRVTRAYVSTLPAVINGRTNWGLPRELAQFIFTPSLDDSDAVEVRVYPAISFSPVGFAHDPCFAALIKSVSWLPSLPANLMHTHVKLFQPPLEPSAQPSRDGLVAAPKWHVVDCSAYNGYAKPFRYEGLIKPNEPEPGAREDAQPAKRVVHKTGIADGIGFPEVEPYRIGIHWTHFELTLSQAVPLATL